MISVLDFLIGCKQIHISYKNINHNSLYKKIYNIFMLLYGDKKEKKEGFFVVMILDAKDYKM